MIVFTTGQAAKICGVSPRTVAKWFDAGSLKGYRIPNSQDRRIPAFMLLKFMREHGMPMKEIEKLVYAHVLLIGLPASEAKAIDDALSVYSYFRCYIEVSQFTAGMRAISFNPDVIVVDGSCGTAALRPLCDAMNQYGDGDKRWVVGLMPNKRPNSNRRQQESLSTDRSIFSECFDRPFDPELLVMRIRSLVRTKKELELERV